MNKLLETQRAYVKAMRAKILDEILGGSGGGSVKWFFGV